MTVILWKKHKKVRSFSKEPLSEIGRNVTDAVASSFTRLAERACSEVEVAISEGVPSQILKALSAPGFSNSVILNPDQRLLDLLLKVDLSNWSVSDKTVFLQKRIYLAGRLASFGLIYDDAEWLLRNSILSELEIDALHLAMANGASQLGNGREAYRRYVELLNKKGLHPANRAWAHRGLAILLGDGPQAHSHALAARDNFLQTGNRYQASQSCASMGQILESKNLSLALDWYDKAKELLNSNDPSESEFIADLESQRAHILLRVGEYNAAANTALSAANRYGSIVGDEEETILLLQFAARASRLAENELEDEFISRLEELRSGLLQVPLSVRVDAAIGERNLNDLERCEQECLNSRQNKLAACCRLAMLLCVPHEPAIQKLKWIDLAHHYVKGMKQVTDIEEILHLAAADIYLQEGNQELALKEYEDAFVLNPFNELTRHNVIALLLQLEKWPAAIEFLEGERGRFGETVSIMYLLGKAYRKMGAPLKALKALTAARRLTSGDESAEKTIDLELQQALTGLDLDEDTGLQMPAQAVPIISLDALRNLLAEFADLIKSEMRMHFWRKDTLGKKRKWAERPEALAKALLHAFLKGKLGGQIEILEEVSAGAGRMDLYIRLGDQHFIVVELKMCGLNYSKNYAAGGWDQLSHYMDNKKTAAGFLVVFDGRIEDFGSGFPAVQIINQRTIFTVPIDIRHDIRC